MADDEIKKLSAEEYRVLMEEIYDNLPDDLQEAVVSLSTREFIKLVGEKSNLSPDKMAELEDETISVMLGITSPKEYVPNLGQRLNIDLKTAREMAEEINAQIFSKVRDSLKLIHGLTPESEVKTESIPISTPIPATPQPTQTPPAPPTPTPPSVSIGEEKISPFEAKTKQEIFRAAPEESKQSGYAGGADPYREQIE